MTSKKTLLQDGDVFQDNETLVFDPYNKNNKEITKEQVQKKLDTGMWSTKSINIEFNYNDGILNYIRKLSEDTTSF